MCLPPVTDGFQHREELPPVTDGVQDLEPLYDKENSEYIKWRIRTGQGLPPLENSENSGIFRCQKSPVNHDKSITTKSEFYRQSPVQQVVLSDDQFKAIMKELKAIRKALKKRGQV